MEKHADTCNYIIKKLCWRKSYQGELRQIIVTARTWRREILQDFLNEKIIGAESVLVIGNHLEAAFWAGVVFEFVTCTTDLKLGRLLGKHFSFIRSFQIVID